MFEENRNNIVISWKIVRSIINKKQTTSNSGSFGINIRNEQNKDLIANGFNELYVNIGPALAGKIPTGKSDHITCVKIVSQIRYVYDQEMRLRSRIY